MTEKNKRFTKGIVRKREDLTSDLWKVWIEPEEKFNFDPGQYCTVGYDNIERPYSIASSPDENLIELFIELVPEPLGNLTPLLYELNIGAEITLRKRPKGIFKFQSQFKNHIMISTVTGVAPFVSMIRSIDFKNTDYKIWIFEGASFINEFGYSNELTSISKTNEKIMPDAVFKKLLRVFLTSLFKTDINLIDKTGNTHGITFKIKPPKNDITKYKIIVFLKKFFLGNSSNATLSI